MNIRMLPSLALMVILTLLMVVAGVQVQAADLSKGVEIYAEHCEYCHGPSGRGMAGMGELRPWKELMKPDVDLFDTIRDGSMAMPGFDGLLTSEEILDVIAYMRTFQ